MCARQLVQGAVRFSSLSLQPLERKSENQKTLEEGRTRFFPPPPHFSLFSSSLLLLLLMVLFLVPLWPVFSTSCTTFPLYDEVLSVVLYDLSFPNLQLQRCGSSFALVSVSTKLTASSIVTTAGFVMVFKSDLFRSPLLRWIQPPTCSFIDLTGRLLISPSFLYRPAPPRRPPKSLIFGLLCCFIYCFCLYFWLLYCCLLDYFLLMIVGVWVLFYVVDPTFLGAGSMVVLFASVLEDFLSTLILPLLAVLCGRLCSLDGLDHSFDPFLTVLWFWFSFGISFWLVQGVCLGYPPIFIGSPTFSSFQIKSSNDPPL